MAVSIKDKETLKYLADLEKDILDEYNNLADGTFSQERMLSLLDMESDLLNSVNLNRELVVHVETAVRDEIGGCFYYELPTSIGPFMTDETYPYIRLLSRVRYMFKQKNDRELSSSSIPFQDLEVALLYKSLMSDSEVHTDIYESMQKSAWTVLIDSPSVERAVVSQGMNPLEEIDDAVEFQANLFDVISKKKSTQNNSVENDIICARAIRFAITYKEILELLSKYFGLYKSGQDVTPTIMMYISYLKTIIAAQSKAKREHVYKEFIKDNAEAIREDKEYFNYIKHSVSDIENNLAPSVRRISFMNKPFTM